MFLDLRFFFQFQNFLLHFGLFVYLLLNQISGFVSHFEFWFLYSTLIRIWGTYYWQDSKRSECKIGFSFDLSFITPQSRFFLNDWFKQILVDKLIPGPCPWELTYFISDSFTDVRVSSNLLQDTSVMQFYTMVWPTDVFPHSRSVSNQEVT